MPKAKIKTPGIPDEAIISALLQNGSQRAAAAALGVDERTIYNRMNTGEFKALYKTAKADMVRDAVININKQLAAAIQVVVDVMNDKDNNPVVRLQAAQTILNNAGKFAERLQVEETAVAVQINSNRFSMD